MLSNAAFFRANSTCSLMRFPIRSIIRMFTKLQIPWFVKVRVPNNSMYPRVKSELTVVWWNFWNMHSLSMVLHKVFPAEKMLTKVSRKNWWTPDRHNTKLHNKVNTEQLVDWVLGNALEGRIKSTREMSVMELWTSVEVVLMIWFSAVFVTLCWWAITDVKCF